MKISRLASSTDSSKHIHPERRDDALLDLLKKSGGFSFFHLTVFDLEGFFYGS
jgi:hypothetical protein